MGGNHMLTPVISFKGYEIKNFNYSKEKKEESDIEKPFSVHVNAEATEKLAYGKVNVHVKYELVNVTIFIEVDGFFEINDDENEETVMKHLTVNGTAIVFPYIRSMVSMLTSLDSDAAVILPTINTTDFLSK